MVLLCWIIDYFATFLELFILLKIVCLIYKNKLNLLHTIIASLCYATVIILINQIEIASLYTSFIGILMMIISTKIIYHVNVFSLASISIFYVLCLSCGDYLVIITLSVLFGSDTILQSLLVPGIYRILFIVLMKAILISCFFALKRFFALLGHGKNRVLGLIIICGGGYAGFAFLVKTTQAGIVKQLPTMWLSLLLILALVVFVVFFWMQMKEDRMKITQEQLQNNLLEEKYDSVNKIYTQNAKLYHDLNNHLNVLYNMLDDESSTNAKQYISELATPIHVLARSVWTGNNIVDVVINSKIEIMEERGIPYSINVEFPQTTNITPADICTILSNLLDNAIEAAEQVDENDRTPVDIQMRKINQFLMIQISNPTTRKDDENPDLRTTKQDKRIHGWGVSNVRSVVEKYNGTIEFETHNKIFTVTLMIFYNYLQNTDEE